MQVVQVIQLVLTCTFRLIEATIVLLLSMTCQEYGGG